MGINLNWKWLEPPVSFSQQLKFTMECSICFEEINKQTGSVVLSCEHSFHFRCIENWFSKQIYDDLAQTCPCCRSAGTELDRCEVVEVNDDEDDDETYEEEESVAESEELIERINEQVPRDDFLFERNNITGQLLITPLEHIAMQQFRNLFGRLNDFEEYGEPPAPARVQRIREDDPGAFTIYHWRRDVGVIDSNPAPTDASELLRYPEGDPRRRVVYHWERDAGVIVPLPPNYVEDLERQEAARQEAAQKIQAFFRGNQVRNTHEAAVTLLRLFQQAYN